jgi:hypothetical protein
MNFGGRSRRTEDVRCRSTARPLEHDNLSASPERAKQRFETLGAPDAEVDVVGRRYGQNTERRCLRSRTSMDHAQPPASGITWSGLRFFAAPTAERAEFALHGEHRWPVASGQELLKSPLDGYVQTRSTGIRPASSRCGRKPHRRTGHRLREAQF